MIPKSKEISEFLVTMSAGGVSISRVTKGIIKIFLNAWDLMVFPEMTLIWTNLSECSMAFMAFENRDLSARVRVGRWDRNVCFRVVWDMDSSITGHGRHGGSMYELIDQNVFEACAMVVTSRDCGASPGLGF